MQNDMFLKGSPSIMIIMIIIVAIIIMIIITFYNSIFSGQVII